MGFFSSIGNIAKKVVGGAKTVIGTASKVLGGGTTPGSWGDIAMTGASVIGSVLSSRQATKAAGQEAEALARAGKAEQMSAYMSAAQMEQNAKNQEAIAQRAAQEELKRAELLQSRALAVAGASGAGVGDPTIMKIVGDIAAEGKLAAENQLYSGKEAARAMRIGAKVARWEGDMALQGAFVQSRAARDAIGGIRMQSILDITKTTAAWHERLPRDSEGNIKWDL